MIALNRSRLLVLKAVLWIEECGRPVDGSSPWRIIKQRIQALIGIAIDPHFIRHCIATTMTIEHPEMITSLHVVLQHHEFRVTERHYVLAQQLQAFKQQGEALEDIRRSLQNIDDQKGDLY